MEYQIPFPKNVLNSSVRKKLITANKSLKDVYVSLNSHNDLIVQSDKLPEDQDLNKTAILDMYNSSQDVKPIVNIKESEDYLCLTKDNTSPELLRQKNPFIKRVSNLTTSPSVLSNGNCRKKGKNLMRIRRTVIDETNIIESKYFLKQDNKEHSIIELKNKEIETNSKSTKYNTIPNMDTSVHDISQEQLEKTLSITNITQNAKYLRENTDNVILLNQNDYLTNRNVPEKSNFGINDVLVTHSTIDENYISDNCLVSSSSNMETNITNYENANSLQNDLSKWSNIENDRISYKRDIFKKQSKTNLVNTHTCARAFS